MKFAFLSWLYILLLNAILGSFFMSLHTGEVFSGDSFFEMFFIVGIFSLPFSIPGLVLLVFAVQLSKSMIHDGQPFLMIMIFALAGTAACYGVVGLLFGLNILKDFYPLAGASFLSVILALIINRKMYYQYLLSLNKQA